MRILLFSIFLLSFVYGKTLSIVKTELIKTSANIEPSGLVYDNQSKSIFVISDNGYFCEIKKDGSELCSRNKKRDYEGLTVKKDGSLIAVEEGNDRIIYLNKSGNVLNKVPVDRYFNGNLVLNEKGNGLESIAFYKSIGDKDFFFVGNQSKKFEGDDKSAILYVSVDQNSFFKSKAVTLNYFPMKIKDISDMTFYQHRLFVLSDKENKLFVFSFENEKLILEDAFDIPGEDQEGISIFGDKIYIAQDSGDILVLTIGFKRF